MRFYLGMYTRGSRRFITQRGLDNYFLVPLNRMWKIDAFDLSDSTQKGPAKISLIHAKGTHR